jgi:3-deoxy-D-manno-octulosonate 8-phosphate phosphatase KdsC-like HAD superfamily phosphatase
MVSNRSDINTGKLLLLDLDGVLVTDGDGDTSVGSEIIKIHKELVTQLNNLSLPVAILTHRSRCEAMQIIDALGLSTHQLYNIFTANDIFFFGLRFKGVSFLVKNGSKKSIILSYIQKRYNIQAKNIAFIDDRLWNVEDLMNAGIGLGINVPAAKVINQHKIVTFSLCAALDKVKRWYELGELSTNSNQIIRMQSVTIDLPEDAFSGILIRRQWSDFFGLTRSALRYTRKIIMWIIS